MADAPATGVAYRGRRLAGVDEGGAEPKVARPARAEKIACAHDQRGHAFGRGSLQAALDFRTDRPFTCFRMLRRILAQDRPGVGPEIVDRSREEDARATRLCRRNARIEHRHDELRPVSIAGRIDGVDDERDAVGRRDHVDSVHGVPFHPVKPVVKSARRLTPAVQREDAPSAGF